MLGSCSAGLYLRLPPSLLPTHARLCYLPALVANFAEDRLNPLLAPPFGPPLPCVLRQATAGASPPSHRGYEPPRKVDEIQKQSGLVEMLEQRKYLMLDEKDDKILEQSGLVEMLEQVEIISATRKDYENESAKRGKLLHQLVQGSLVSWPI